MKKFFTACLMMLFFVGFSTPMEFNMKKSEPTIEKGLFVIDKAIVNTPIFVISHEQESPPDYGLINKNQYLYINQTSKVKSVTINLNKSKKATIDRQYKSRKLFVVDNKRPSERHKKSNTFFAQRIPPNWC